jgi:hypothetical protein
MPRESVGFGKVLFATSHRLKHDGFGAFCFRNSSKIIGWPHLPDGARRSTAPAARGTREVGPRRTDRMKDIERGHHDGSTTGSLGSTTPASRVRRGPRGRRNCPVGHQSPSIAQRRAHLRCASGVASATVARRAKAAETQPAERAGFAGFATPPATSPVAFPACDPTELNQRPPTKGTLAELHHGVNDGFELIHFAPINYHSARSSRIWTVGAIFRPVRGLAPSSSAWSTAWTARRPPPEPAS